MRLSISFLLALVSLACANDWQTIRNCRLMDNESNDGDSFHVKADGEERIFRLYFVDTPESEGGGRVAERVTEQAKEFGITEEETIEMGKKATAFTRSVLSRPFEVTTRGQNALGASKLPREYAFIETADGEDLGEMLVSRGLARSFGQVAALEPYTASELRDKYDRLEAKARRDRVGAWGEDAASPTMEIEVGALDSQAAFDNSPFASFSYLNKRLVEPRITRVTTEGVELADKNGQRVAVPLDKAIKLPELQMRARKAMADALSNRDWDSDKAEATVVAGIDNGENAAMHSERALAHTNADALIAFGDISLGATERDFRRAYPYAELIKAPRNPNKAESIYSLLPPDSIDADQVRFIFRDGKLFQMDHIFGKQRLDERGGEDVDGQALSQLFGNQGQTYQPAASGPKVKSARRWLSPRTGEAASLEFYPDGSAKVSFYKSTR